MGRVALKMILNYGANTHDVALHNQKDYSILYQINSVHPNVVPVLAEFTAAPSKEMMEMIPDKTVEQVKELFWNFRKDRFSTTQFYVTEKYETNLECRLRSRLSKEQTRNYSLDAAAAVYYLFENHVAHRDIKPNNFLVSAEDKILLSDFGESVFLDKNYSIASSDIGAGNIQFLAPDVTEQMIVANRANKPAVICFASQYSWEVGCLVYWICCGEFPFATYPHVSMQIRPPKFDRTLGLSSEFINLLSSALVASGETRIPFGEFYAKLQTVSFFV